MPKLRYKTPTYRRHAASGQALVEIAGRRYYLGPFRSPESRSRYDALLAEWIAAGRPSDFSPAGHPANVDPVNDPSPRPGDATIAQLIAGFWQFAKRRYEKHGRSTGTHENYRPVLRLLRKRHAETRVRDFGPRTLKTLQAEMVAAGNSRRYVNDNVDRVRRIFAWGVSEELVEPNTLAALQTVESVSKGAAGVVEHPPVEPVPDEVVDQTLPFLSPVVAQGNRASEKRCHYCMVCSSGKGLVRGSWFLFR